MKKLFFAVFALAALSLLAPSTGFAQSAWNQLGIYTDSTGDPATANFTASLGVPFTAYLVLTNPVNEALGNPPTVAPITAVDGFECKLVSPVDNTLFFQLTETFGGNAINVGIAPDYVVGFAESVPVTGNAVVLVTWSFMAVAPGTYDFFLDITDIPGIPGVMSVVDGNEVDNNLVPVYRSTNGGASWERVLFVSDEVEIGRASCRERV